MARTKTKPKKEPLVIKSVALTPATVETLQRLSQEGSDFTGWTVSSSAIMRALLRYAGEQPFRWASSQLFPLVEREIQAGVIWGSKKL